MRDFLETEEGKFGLKRGHIFADSATLTPSFKVRILIPLPARLKAWAFSLIFCPKYPDLSIIA